VVRSTYDPCMGRFRVDEATAPAAVEGWVSIADPTKVQGSEVAASRREAAEAWGKAQARIAEILQCDHVLVLAGLGTSLCIKTPGGGTLFPTMGDLWRRVRASVTDKKFDAIRAHVHQSAGENIEDLLSRCQMAIELQSTNTTGGITTADLEAFVASAEAVIRDSCGADLPEGSTAVHEDFLRRLTRRHSRQPRACLFTTNYDLCFDVAAARIGLAVIDGFSFASPPRYQPDSFDHDIVSNSSYSKDAELIARLLRVFKLHGSVDWHPSGTSIEKQPHTKKPVLIYPQSGKYATSYSPPFLEMMSRFQVALRQRNVGLLVVCSGLGDLHLAEPVIAAIKANTSLRAVFCCPDLCDKDAQALRSDTNAKGLVATGRVFALASQLVDAGDGRLSLLNGTLGDITRLMPILPLQTEADQHDQRLRKLEDAMRKQDTSGAGS
jgi:hypothetical protein